jgi:cyclic pyranopterin phosphate synthase
MIDPQSSSPEGLSHVQADGTFRMVDVSEKAVTVRVAVASGAIRMRAETLEALRSHTLAKGDVVPVARLAGVLAAKRTADLIPLCHPLPLSGIDVVVTFDDSLPGVRVEGSVRTTAQTGVEMEALTAVSVALLTVYDMAKAVDRTMEITGITLREKRGGRSGSWPPGS